MDWREIFKRYVAVVVQCEGVDFLYKSEWTNEEWEEIQKALTEVYK